MESTGNKYNSKTESFSSDCLFNALLSTKATPPADLVLAPGDFTAKDCFPRLTDTFYAARPNFAINDVPRLLGIGLWCNIADGLVANDTNDGGTYGMSLRIRWQGYTLGVKTQDDIAQNVVVKITEWNQIFSIDSLFDASGLTAGQDATRLNVSIVSTMTFSTITVDPLFAAKRLLIRPMLLVEHSRVTT